MRMRENLAAAAIVILLITSGLWLIDHLRASARKWSASRPATAIVCRSIRLRRRPFIQSVRTNEHVVRESVSDRTGSRRSGAETLAAARDVGGLLRVPLV